MRRLVLAMSAGLMLVASASAQSLQAPAAVATASPRPAEPSAESIALARRYLQLAGMVEQMQASFDWSLKPMVQMARTAAPTMSNDTAARLEILIHEEYGKTLQRFMDTYSRRLAARLSEDDLRTVVRLMESDPAVARLTAAVIDATPELTELAVNDSAGAMAMAMSRLRRERRL